MSTSDDSGDELKLKVCKGSLLQSGERRNSRLEDLKR